MIPLQYVTVAEVGGTHATWTVFRVPTCHEGAPWLHPDAALVGQLTTPGLNPNQVSDPDLFERIGYGWLQVVKTIPLARHTAHIYWYGAGCASQENKLRVLDALSLTSRLPKLHLHVSTDLALVAEACLPNQDGLILIMGTGAALAYVQQGRVVHTESSIFPKGNEGSGAYLGRKLYMYVEQLDSGHVPEYLSEAKSWLPSYNAESQSDMGAFFTRWLAHVQQYASSGVEQLTQALLKEGFSAAVNAFLTEKAHKQDLLQHLVVCGSVAFHQKDYLLAAFEQAALPCPIQIEQSISKSWMSGRYTTVE